MRYEEIKVGDVESITKTFSESDVYLFAGITLDNNPIHINTVYAFNTPFNKRLVHGLLTSGLISAVLGTRLPGPGTIYLKQTLNFLEPVFINDTITAKVEVKEKIEPKNRLILSTVCVNQENKTVITGEAIVKFK